MARDRSANVQPARFSGMGVSRSGVTPVTPRNRPAGAVLEPGEGAVVDPCPKGETE